MTFYAELPLRRALQVAGDLLLVVWVVAWILVGRGVHGATLALAKPGRELREGATGLGERMRSAGRAVDDVPLVGKSVRKPFSGAGDAADKVAAAGQSQVDAVGHLALWLGFAVALIPILVAIGYYLPPRIRFVRRATAGRRFLDSTADLDLFALRAMAHQPLHVLARISDDPAGAWRQRDPVVVRSLATLELKASGLRPPEVSDALP